MITRHPFLSKTRFLSSQRIGKDKTRPDKHIDHYAPLVFPRYECIFTVTQALPHTKRGDGTDPKNVGPVVQVICFLIGLFLFSFSDRAFLFDHLILFLFRMWMWTVEMLKCSFCFFFLLSSFFLLPSSFFLLPSSVLLLFCCSVVAAVLWATATFCGGPGSKSQVSRSGGSRKLDEITPSSGLRTARSRLDCFVIVVSILRLFFFFCLHCHAMPCHSIVIILFVLVFVFVILIVVFWLSLSSNWPTLSSVTVLERFWFDHSDASFGAADGHGHASQPHRLGQKIDGVCWHVRGLVMSFLVLSCLVLSCLALSCLVLSCLVLFCVIVSCRVVLPCRVVSCRIVSCRVVSCRVVSCRVVSCRVVSCRVVSCRVVSCRVVSFLVVLCGVVWCCVVLCCVVLCCVVLCCVVLSYLILSYLVLSCPVLLLSCPVLSCLIASCHASSCLVVSCRALSRSCLFFVLSLFCLFSSCIVSVIELSCLVSVLVLPLQGTYKNELISTIVYICSRDKFAFLIDAGSYLVYLILSNLIIYYLFILSYLHLSYLSLSYPHLILA